MAIRTANGELSPIRETLAIVKQADLRVGSEYAFPTYKPYDGGPLAACVRVVSIDGGGRVTVRVIDPGTKPPK